LFLITNIRGSKFFPRGKLTILNSSLSVLSRKSDHRIRLLELFPKVPNNVDVMKPFNQPLWEQVFYCPGIEMYTRESRMEQRNRTLSLRFETQHGGAVSHFHVDLWLEPRASRCHIAVPEKEEVMKWLKHGDYGLSTDRAEYELTYDRRMASSCFVTVSVKSQLSDGSACYKVYINILESP
jgi:hypothetical protein